MKTGTAITKWRHYLFTKKQRPVFNPIFLITLGCLCIPYFIALIPFRLTPKPVAALPGKLAIYSLSFTKDGKSVLLGGNHNSAWILDASSGAVANQFPLKSDKVVSVDITPDANTAAFCEIDGTFSLWNAATKKKIVSHSLATIQKTDPLDNETVSRFRIALSPDASKVMLNDWENGLRLIDCQSGKTLYTFSEGMKTEIPWFSFSHCGKSAVVIDPASAETRIYDFNTTKERSFPVGAIPFNAALLTPDDTSVILGCADGLTRIWDLNTGKLSHYFRHPQPVSALGVSPDGSQLFIGGNDGVIAVWNLISHSYEKTFYCESALIFGLSQPANDNFFVMLRSGKFWKWDGGTNRSLWSIDGVRVAGKGEIIALEKDTSPKLPSSTDLSQLDKPMDKHYDIENEGIDRILERLQADTGISIYINNAIRFQGNLKTPISAARLLGDALKAYSLDYLILSNGVIRIGRAKTLKKYSQNATEKRLTDILDYPVKLSPQFEFLYISDVVKRIDPQNRFKFLIEDEPYPRATIHLHNPTPRQVLDAVLSPNGLDYFIENFIIQIDKKNENITSEKPLIDASFLRDEILVKKRLNQTIAGVFQVENKSLKEVLEDIRTRVDFPYETGADLSIPISIRLESPTLSHLLNSILPPQGLAYAYKKNGILRIDRLETIEKDADLFFLPDQFASFLINYHSRFQTAQIVYSGTDVSFPFVENMQGYDDFYRLPDFKRVQKLREHGYGTAIEKIKEKEKETKRLLTAFKIISDEELQKLIENKERLYAGFTREATRVYFVDRDYRRLEVQWPGDAIGVHDYVLAESIEGNLNLLHHAISPKNQLIDNELRAPDRPLRFGADLDWMLSCGYKIQNIDWRERKFILAPLGASLQKDLYEFTLLDGRNAYWKECAVLSFNSVPRRILCDDFTIIDGMLIPKSVQVQDAYGEECLYRTEELSGQDTGILNRMISTQVSLFGSKRNRYDYAMKLVEAKINQPIEKKPQ